MSGRLKGQNNIKEFRRIAQSLVAKIATYKDVAGIVFLGGLVRGFVDKWSDLDITVFLSKRDERLRKQIIKTGSNTQKRFKIDIDLEVHSLEDFKKRQWNETDKWDFSNSKIAFDPEGKIKGLFRQKLRSPKNFWTRRIAVCAEYLKWYCCPPKDNIGTIAETWVDRGDLLAAHYCLSYAVDLLIEMIFALNKEYLPPPKWRMSYSYSLPWSPDSYRKLIEQAMNAKRPSLTEIKRRLEATREMWHKILPKLEEETGMTQDQLSKYYVTEILGQTWIKD
jgi:predicted nucleotidyltransferase